MQSSADQILPAGNGAAGRISMDIYEPAEMRRALVKLGIEVTVAYLGVGDYVLSDLICIERKTVSDFLSSMYSGRLGYQLHHLSGTFRMPFLLIEGRPEYRPRVVNMKSFYGYLSRLVLSSPIGLLQTPDMATSALLISLMSQKIGGSPSNPRLRPTKARGEKETALLLLETLPGVGPVLSRRLLEEFRSLRSVLQAPHESMSKVRGLGGRRARRIVDLLDRTFEA